LAGKGFAYGAGEVLNLPSSEAEYYIREGLATKEFEDETPEAKRPLIPKVEAKTPKGKKVQTR